MKNNLITEEYIRTELKQVKDPEIPTISIVDLGIVTGIDISEDNDVHVTLTPTFAGCPALRLMEDMEYVYEKSIWTYIMSKPSLLQ